MLSLWFVNQIWKKNPNPVIDEIQITIFYFFAVTIEQMAKSALSLLL